MNDLPPPPLPTLCIRSITESDEPGRFLIDMPSLWRPSPIYNVNQETIDQVADQVVRCPTGYPNPPITE